MVGKEVEIVDSTDMSNPNDKNERPVREDDSMATNENYERNEEFGN